MQLDAEAGIEGALDHALTVNFEHARRRKSPHQCRAHLAGIDAGLGCQQQSFRDRLDIERNDDLVADLADLAGTDIADQGDVLAHQLEQRLHFGEGCLGSADHDGERCILCADFAAGDRGIHVIRTGVLYALGKHLGLDRRDGTHVDDNLARGQSFRDPVLAEKCLLDVRRVRHHSNDDVGFLRDFLRRRTGLPARRRQVLRHATAARQEQRVAALDQIGNHGLAHDAQTDESHIHFFLLRSKSKPNTKARRTQRKTYPGIDADWKKHDVRCRKYSP